MRLNLYKTFAVYFQLVPAFLVHPMALGLPPFEILCGLGLMAGRWKRQAALGVSVLCLLFLGALISAALRGIAVECSCFGGAVAEPLWRLVTRDLLLLGGALTIYLRLLRGTSSLHEPDLYPRVDELNKPLKCLH
ncbi:MAG: hypothetical protein EOP84_29335 [Verrucomicrobiaceae bacterium]|nr:MAG: hypothetical protein EOP84_29335 [Verrucomicrobiaceae bacterium]